MAKEYKTARELELEMKKAVREITGMSSIYYTEQWLKDALSDRATRTDEWSFSAFGYGAPNPPASNVPEAKDVKMDSDLMVLVNSCNTPEQLVESQKSGNALKLAERLKKLGFVAAAMPIEEKASLSHKLARITAEKFVVVKPENIYKFLAKLVTEYNEKYGNKEKVTGHYYKGAKLSAPTCHSQSMKGIGKFEWDECKAEQYTGIPPEKVLTRLEEVKEKGMFDYFTVATVKAVKDPLLLGRLHGCEDRFFIAQWGDDVSLDDVI